MWQKFLWILLGKHSDLKAIALYQSLINRPKRTTRKETNNFNDINQ